MREERISRGRFIRLGAGLGVGTAGASILGACSSGDDSSGGEEEAREPFTVTDSSTSASGEQPLEEGLDGVEVAQGDSIAREGDVTPDSAVPFTVSERREPAVLVRLGDGGLVAYSAVCTHQGCTVAYRQDARKLACPCHGSVFDPANRAEVEVGPANKPLPEIPVEVRNGEVFRA